MELWSIENELYDGGCGLICGVDEAGRGPLAGPVFAAAVILPRNLEIPFLDDSKKVTEKRREKLFEIITDSAVAYCVAFSTEQEIEELNILNATFLAMNRAIAGLEVIPEIALIDGNQNFGLEMKNIPIIGGDGKSASIAAASILAKVSRDRYMLDVAEKYPQYGFENHKGYGTKAHYECLRIYGISAIHRKSFLKKLKGEVAGV